MRKLPKGVVFAGQQLVQVWCADTRITNDDSVGGDIAEALALWAEPANQATHEIKQRQRVYKPEQVAGDDLVKLKPQPLGIDYSQAKEPLADGLAAPLPFASDPIANADNKISQSCGCA